MIVTINGLVWKAHIVSAHDPQMFVNGESCRGVCWSGHQVIALSDELDDRTALRVIKHEVVHAFIMSFLPNPPDSYTEEDLCDFVAIYGDQIAKCAEQIYDKLFAIPGQNAGGATSE